MYFVESWLNAGIVLNKNGVYIWTNQQMTDITHNLLAFKIVILFNFLFPNRDRFDILNKNEVKHYTFGIYLQMTEITYDLLAFRSVIFRTSYFRIAINLFLNQFLNSSSILYFSLKIVFNKATNIFCTLYLFFVY